MWPKRAGLGKRKRRGETRQASEKRFERSLIINIELKNKHERIAELMKELIKTDTNVVTDKGNQTAALSLTKACANLQFRLSVKSGNAG